MNRPPLMALLKKTYRLSGHARGFTIVELMVTVALAAILLSVAVPSFRNMMVSNRLTTQANEVVASMNLARSEAVNRNANVSFCRATSDTATACVTAQGIWQFWIVRSANGTIVRRGAINTYSGTLIMRSTLTSDEVAFGSDGLARTGGALINGQQLTVCATNIATTAKNTRQILMGVGSRLTTKTPNGGACT